MRAKWVVVVVAVCLVVTVAAIAYAAGKTSAPAVIRAQRFEVVDAEGRARRSSFSRRNPTRVLTNVLQCLRPTSAPGGRA